MVLMTIWMVFLSRNLRTVLVSCMRVWWKVCMCTASLCRRQLHFHERFQGRHAGICNLLWTELRALAPCHSMDLFDARMGVI